MKLVPLVVAVALLGANAPAFADTGETQPDTVRKIFGFGFPRGVSAGVSVSPVRFVSVDVRAFTSAFAGGADVSAVLRWQFAPGSRLLVGAGTGLWGELLYCPCGSQRIDQALIGVARRGNGFDLRYTFGLFQLVEDELTAVHVEFTYLF